MRQRFPLRAWVGLVGSVAASLMQLGCSSDVTSSQAVARTLVMRDSPNPVVCGDVSDSLCVGATFELIDPLLGQVSVEAVVPCSYPDAGWAAVLVEPLEGPCASHLVPLPITWDRHDMAIFGDMIDAGGREVRLTVVQGQILSERDVACVLVALDPRAKKSAPP